MSLYKELLKHDRLVDQLKVLIEDLQPIVDDLRSKTSEDTLKWIELGNIQYRIDQTLEYVNKVRNGKV